MGDCVVCQQWLGDDLENIVDLQCISRHINPAAHRSCVAQNVISKELYGKQPFGRDRYFYWCGQNDRQLNAPVCIKVALESCGRQDIREAIKLAETDKTTAIQALERIKNSLQSSDARDQLSRVIAVLGEPAGPQPRPPSYSSLPSTQSSYRPEKRGGLSIGLIIAVVVIVMIVALVAWFLLRGGF